MKAVIVEINGKTVVALKKNGEFVKLKYESDFSVGCEIEIPAARILNVYTFNKIASIAAVFLLLLGSSLGLYAYNRPYSYIDVDINPSIEMVTNVFDRVIMIKGLNSDGQRVLTSGNYKNKDIEACVKTVLDSAVKSGYLITEKNNAVLITVACKNNEKAAKINAAIKSSTEKELKDAKVTAEILTENISMERHEQANKDGISAGKKLLIEKLQKVNPNVKIEDYKNAPIKKIISEMHEKKKEYKASTKEDKDIVTDKYNPNAGKSPHINNNADKKEEKKVDNEVKNNVSNTKKNNEKEKIQGSEKIKEKDNEKKKEKGNEKIQEKEKEQDGEKEKDKNKDNPNNKDLIMETGTQNHNEDISIHNQDKEKKPDKKAGETESSNKQKHDDKVKDNESKEENENNKKDKKD